MIRVNSGSGLMYDNGGPVPPGPPIGGIDKPNANGAHALQQKMHRQRQLALERQRSTARKQLGAGVIASANPLMQNASFKASQWENVPEGLGLPSPSMVNRSRLQKPSDAEAKTAANTPKAEDSKQPEASETPSAKQPMRKKPTFDDVLDGLAEELLLDDRLPVRSSSNGQPGASPPQSRREFGPAGRISPTGKKVGQDAWGGGEPLQKGGPGHRIRGADVIEEATGGVDTVMELSTYGNGPMGGAGGGRRRPQQFRQQQTTIVGEDRDDDQFQVYGFNANQRVETPTPGPRPVGKSWDLHIEERPAESAQNRRPKEKKPWWPFGGGSADQARVEEEVTTVSAFRFDD
eukprot:TRINITY_DN70501_c0_g1_i1.p1 TRINITY_DN70501_c0_g1~~TRINITY_DN70501_c0_g1_i1.p1  ORF type:complete len:348 (+),score=73.98 TRINITY_DN70501_c0_g1_i1:109-1152(+)